MSKHIQLAVPKPCHENWNNMTPSEKGRFCASCQKQVVDFTRMSDSKVAMFFKKPAGSVCGRFMSDQLNHDLEIPRKRIPWVKYFFQFALPAFLLSAKAKAQGEVKILKGDTIAMPLKGKVAVGTPLTCNNEQRSLEKNIKGKIIDNDGKGIAGATLVIKGTTIGTAADNAGNFQLKYNGEKDKIVLAASCIGFEAIETLSICLSQTKLTFNCPWPISHWVK